MQHSPNERVNAALLRYVKWRRKYARPATVVQGPMGNLFALFENGRWWTDSLTAEMLRSPRTRGIRPGGFFDQPPHWQKRLLDGLVLLGVVMQADADDHMRAAFNAAHERHRLSDLREAQRLAKRHDHRVVSGGNRP